MSLKALTSTLIVMAACAGANAQNPPAAGAPTSTGTTPVVLPVSPTVPEKELLNLSRQKWLWMAERNTAALDKVVDEKAVFVHMGATFTKSQELDVIKSGRIEYKQADIQDMSIATIGDTAIVLSTIQLFALVGGNEARNPFTVTETYVRQANGWKLAALAFTRRITPQ